ncbi:Alpha/Beta hydrolase protein [Plectosphaerella cucumerina]|uniref:triacylglycerol lipase n=1 Tax=Plectosphaerella cucumerina TaxID=40658 RepID=A0A8K0X084_9PEZI|nr:Alpha/Beta hydrolase protein [Plectosphaerella cucumerina]
MAPAGRRRRPNIAAALLLAAVTSPIIASASASSPVHEKLVLPGPIAPSIPTAPTPAEHTFKLRHILHHGTYQHPHLHRRKDVPEHISESRVWLAADGDYEREALGPLKAKSMPITIERLVDRRPVTVDPMVAAARERGYVNMLSASDWTLDDTPGPNITDKETVLTLARIAADAYVEDEEQPDWEEVGAPYNRSADFGWQSDGLRGHIFTDETNSTVIIGLKGTSMAVFDGEGTTTNDKVNDNLFFSCCCAQLGHWTWHQVCDCASSGFQCNNTCVVKSLRKENMYYAAARELYANVTAMYPDANIWLSGHSLGGAVSSFLGLTYGLPVVTFEAVPEALPASRLGLPVPPGAHQAIHQAREHTGAAHFGHTADPVYIGSCHAATASCSFAGYAMESQCHTGKRCVYDVVADKGWRVGIGTHRIRSVINDVITQYDDVPKCIASPECRDCAKWTMYESNGTETTTTSAHSKTTTSTRTRTATCQTPGWWGCLDETTGTGSSTTSTSTSSTSTCETPGWFGCNDKTSETTTSTSTSESSTSTACMTPGHFWGCLDASPTTTAATGEPTPEVPTATSTSAPSKAPEEPECQNRAWFGWCWEWEDAGEDRQLGGWRPDEI